MCIPAVSAFMLTDVSVNPPGPLTPGTPVTVWFKVQFTSTSGKTFPAGDDLHFITDLDHPQWDYTIILDGIENPRPRGSYRSLDLSGFQLSYPSKVSETLRINLQGTAPAVGRTSNITIVRVQESARNGNLIESSVVSRTATVVNVGEVPAAVAGMKDNLAAFRSDIDGKAAMGIDTAAAESAYAEASRAIEAAVAIPSAQRTEALRYLDAAQEAIDDGETELDLAWARSEVAAAHLPITSVDALVGWFRGNETTADDPHLSAIIAMREVAANYHSNANDLVASGQYSQARDKAKDAFAKGNESYTLALQRQQALLQEVNGFAQIGSGVRSSGLLVMFGIIGAALVGVGLVVWYRRSHWDELW